MLGVCTSNMFFCLYSSWLGRFCCQWMGSSICH
ncbi:hypothetical protein Goarm_011274 [Gossypium armourianum]|uniref:Uncharacterized protein n=1 Tax=Gossypium armourianum TaxID=34283 RepID=A0A7J9IX24_9ROSI|nr:hypothetical protein [Gossypium armourianum]